MNETLKLGIHGVGSDLLAGQLGDQQGLDLAVFDTSDALEQAVTNGDLAAGVDFPDDFLPSVALGEPTTVNVYVPADTSPDIRTAISGMVRELAFLSRKHLADLTTQRRGDHPRTRPCRRSGAAQEQDATSARHLPADDGDDVARILDRGGDQIENGHRSAGHSPRTSDFLAAKTLLGTALAFTEVVLMMVAIKSFGSEPLVLLTALLLASFLVTGLALLAGSTGRDFIEILLLSVLLIVPMMIPAGAALFPGTAATWIKVLPSYGMTEAIVRASAYGAGWAETAPYLLATLAWCAAVFAVGVLMLKRKVETL